jgi:ribonuclease BN (tRNA processing enzyme)
VRFEEVDDLGDGGAGREDLCDAPLLERGDVVLWDRPSYDHEDVLHPILTQAVQDLRDEGHVGAGEDGDADGVGVLLNCSLDDLLGRLVQTRVNDLHPGVAEGAGDDLRPPVVPVEPRLGDDDADLPRHVRQYMGVKLTVLGSSPAWPNPGSAQSGYLVEGDGRLLLDCGPGVLGRLRESGELAVDAIAITHFHLDHCGDLIPWAWLSAYGPGRNGDRPALWLPPGGIDECHTFADFWGVPQMFEVAFELGEYEGGRPFDAAGFEVEAQRLPHYTMEAYGFRVRDPRNGRLLAYSGDSAPTRELGELARGADLFLCEATLAEGGRDGLPRGHLSASEALAAADGRVLLTHRPIELPAPEGVELAHDGLIVEL